MIGRKVGIWTAVNLELLQPFHAHGAQQAQRSHKVYTEVYVVNDALEIKGVVGAVHLTRVRRLQAELVYQLRFSGGETHPRTHRGAESLEESVVTVALQVLVVSGDASTGEELGNGRVGEGVEITTH